MAVPRILGEPQANFRWLVHVDCAEPDAAVFRRLLDCSHVCAVCGRRWDEGPILTAGAMPELGLDYRFVPAARIRELEVHGHVFGFEEPSPAPEFSERLAPPPGWLQAYRPAR